MNAQPDGRAGLAYGIGVYLFWGLVPLYFVLLTGIDAIEIVAHRILWSVPLLLVLLAALGWLGRLRKALGTPRILRALAVSALLIAVNWLVYIWAVTHQHVLAASLGYFLNPLINVLLGTALLGERLRPATILAILFAATGVAILAFGALDTLWISLTLAFSFALYGYLRKITEVGAIEGLAVETMLLAPACLGYLIWLTSRGTLAFGTDPTTDTLLIVSAAVTSTPLMLFAAAARRLTLTTLGFLQYIAPSMAFLIGFFILGEPLATPQLVCFALIWTGLAIFSLDNLRAARRRRALKRAAEAYGR
ncbi:MAG: EamA family transporter RarD [Sphingomonadales bacterium]|nr:EamA family transporter RarD [Sphingomonadales bacterium]